MFSHIITNTFPIQVNAKDMKTDKMEDCHDTHPQSKSRQSVLCHGTGTGRLSFIMATYKCTRRN